MKSIRLITVVLVVITIFSALDSQAQDKNKAKNKGKDKTVQKGGGPPPWAPAHGYRAKTRYVYFKDHDVYYDNDKGVYISLSGKNWTVSAKLPLSLKGVDLVAAAKIDLDFSGDEPQVDHESHVKKYPKDKKKSK